MPFADGSGRPGACRLTLARIRPGGAPGCSTRTVALGRALLRASFRRTEARAFLALLSGRPPPGSSPAICSAPFEDRGMSVVTRTCRSTGGGSGCAFGKPVLSSRSVIAVFVYLRHLRLDGQGLAASGRIRRTCRRCVFSCVDPVSRRDVAVRSMWVFPLAETACRSCGLGVGSRCVRMERWPRLIRRSQPPTAGLCRVRLLVFDGRLEGDLRPRAEARAVVYRGGASRPASGFELRRG